jgi:hypothetical protein
MTKHLTFLLFAIIVSFSTVLSQTYEVCKKDTLFGVCNDQGKVMIPQIYREVFQCANYPDRYIVNLKGKFGVVDIANKSILPAEYECNIIYDNPFVIDGGKAYFDSTSTIILKKNGKYGMYNAGFKPLIPFNYDYLAVFGNYTSQTLVAKKLKNYMLIDKNQKVLSKPDYIDFASFYSFSMYRNVYCIFMNAQKKWIFLDEQGKEYSTAFAKTEYGNDTIAEKIEAVRYNNKFAAMDYQGNMVAQGFDELSNFVPVYPDNSLLYASFSKKNKYGILRSDGVEVVKSAYDHIDPIYITGQVCKVSINGKVGIVDLNTGKEIVPPTYDDIWVFGWLKEVTYAKKGEKCALLNNKGILITDFIFDDIQTYQDDLYGAKKDGKWGYIDLKGNIVIPCEYDNTEGFFNEQLIPLKKDGKFGYVGRDGKAITEFKYDKAERFLNKEKAKIELGLKTGWIDKQGKEEWNN